MLSSEKAFQKSQLAVDEQTLNRYNLICHELGGLSEWFKVQLSKSCVPQGTVGSNPMPSV